MEISLIIANTDITAVAFEVVCDSGLTLNGEFNVDDSQDPPVWSAIMDLPLGDCSITLTAFDDAGELLCEGSADFTVLLDETVDVNVVLTCPVGGDDPLGTVDIAATFETVGGNNCPRLHFLERGTKRRSGRRGVRVTVLVSDADGDPLTTALTATGGSFADPSRKRPPTPAMAPTELKRSS